MTDARETGFYDRNADKFIRDTLTVDMTAVLHRFIEHLPEGAAILDAGCGAGRDAKNFLNMGYSVTAFDAAGSMVRHAADYTGLPVTQLTFQEMTWQKTFDGIWCCASLLHVPTVEFEDVLMRLHAALRPGGVCYMSFKYGVGERLATGRFFSDHTEATLEKAVGVTPDFRLIDIWTSPDARPDRASEFWLNAIAKRA